MSDPTEWPLRHDAAMFGRRFVFLHLTWPAFTPIQGCFATGPRNLGPLGTQWWLFAEVDTARKLQVYVRTDHVPDSRISFDLQPVIGLIRAKRKHMPVTSLEDEDKGMWIKSTNLDGCRLFSDVR